MLPSSKKTAIITGASRGIGFGIATCLARNGANIVVADIDGAGARSSALRLEEKFGIKAIGITCDVADRASVQQCIDQAVARFTHIDILVNNAGICPFVDVNDIDEATFRKTIEVNLMGSFHFAQIVGSHMTKSARPGRIVFITSLAENVTGPAQVDYGASKGGLRMLMRGFATAFGPHGVTCNAVAPGMIYTEMTRWHYDKPENMALAKKRIPVGRLGQPEDIGMAVAFLVSDHASYINGISLVVDGGHQTRSD